MMKSFNSSSISSLSLLIFCLIIIVKGGHGQQQVNNNRPAIPISSSIAPAPQHQYYTAAPNKPAPKPVTHQISPQQAQYLNQQRQQSQQQQQSFRIQSSPTPQPPQPSPQPIVYHQQKQAPQKHVQRQAPPPPSRSQQQSQPSKQQQQQLLSSEDYSEETSAEPDRLTLLLQSSKFTCPSPKKDGYYADESLNCEVFHYCHDMVKHSWMCPNQFVFHQVHLICVPPSSENICKQSSSFHFVNEYLYRPVNVKENELNSSIGLRYGDRYYPEGYVHGAEQLEYINRAGSELRAQQYVLPTASTKSPNPNGKQSNVYYSADSINIPLTQRRIVAGHQTNNGNSRQGQASQQQQQQQQVLSDEDEEYYDD